jgi:hypothetical protein
MDKRDFRYLVGEVFFWIQIVMSIVSVAGITFIIAHFMAKYW